MEPTITQNSALYLAQRSISKRRSAFFRRLRITTRNQIGDVQRRTIGGLISRFQDDGR
jgi:hypothetical protein